MEPALNDLMIKIKAIAQGPNAEMLRKLVDVLYEQAERRDEFDEEVFSPEDLAAIKEGEEAFKRSEFIGLEDYEKERGPSATACNYRCL
jgi:hypothetical protein